MDEFIDPSSEQSFASMLLERIEKLEKDNEKLKELVFRKPIVIADSAKELYNALLAFDEFVISYNETGSGLIPDSVFALLAFDEFVISSNETGLVPDSVIALLSKKAQKDARKFAELTADPIAYNDIFIYPIEILRSCKETCAPEIVSWIKELTTANLKKLKVDNDRHIN